MSYSNDIPADVVGMRLCKVVGEKLRISEVCIFTNGRQAVLGTLNRAAIHGKIGKVGDTGDYWADLFIDETTWTETIALSREAWNGLKNKWMKVKMEPYA